MRVIDTKKIMTVLLGSLLIILVGGLLIWNINSGNKTKLDEVKLKYEDNDSGMFAIMLEQEDGSYIESTDNNWPSDGTRVYNEKMSGCIDANGNTLSDILSFDAVNNKAVVRTKGATFCYLYFSFPIPDLKVTDVDTTKLNTSKYIKSLDCGETGSATFNTKYQRIEVSSITAPAECKMTYTEDTNSYPKLNQYIIDMAVEGTSDGTGQAEGDVVHETFTDADNNIVDTGYRYEGKSPNNYIWFNNELWRIIGVFDTCTELDDSGNCTKTETLTKIMRNESIGGLVWNTSSDNNWPSSSLYNLLNTNYLNSSNGTDSGYCYGWKTTVKANCDYSEIGLKGTSSYYGSMIKNVVWNLGGMSSTSGAENYYQNPPSTWYIYERGTIVYSGNDTKIIGYIGLIYGSDYGYSVKASSNCNRSKKLISYNTAYCAGESWMYGHGMEKMITPDSTYVSYAWRMESNGRVTNASVVSAQSINPVLYLDDSTYVINGEEDNVGSISNPYVIGK